MSKNIKDLPLDSCKKCENFRTKPIPTEDSFCRPEKWYCEKNGVTIDGYHDLTDRDPGIPDGCPLDDFKPKKNNMSKKVLTTPEEIYKKIEDTYATEGGKKFITHLIRSYFPIGKADYVWDKKDKPMVCCISGVGLVSKGDVFETMQNITPKEFCEDMRITMGLATGENESPEPHQPILVKKLNGRILGLETKESDKFMCKEAYQQLYNFYCNKVLHGDGHMNWVGKKMMVDTAVKNMREKGKITPQEEKVVNKNVNKPHKLTLGDLGVLQGLKEKLEKEGK